MESINLSAHTVTILTGPDNWQRWRRVFRTQAKANDVWNLCVAGHTTNAEGQIVVGTEAREKLIPRPTKPTRAPTSGESKLSAEEFAAELAEYKLNLEEYTEQQKRVRRFFQLLIQLVHPNLHAVWEGEEDPKKVADRLSAACKPSNTRLLLTAESALERLSIYQCGNITNLLLEAESLRTDISEATNQTAMTDQQLIGKIVNRLPAPYKAFVDDYQRGIDDPNVTNPTMAVFSARLHAEELRIKDERRKLTLRNSRGPRDGNDRSKRTQTAYCPECKIKGHDLSTCWKKHPEQAPKRNTNGTQERRSKPSGMVAAAFMNPYCNASNTKGMSRDTFKDADSLKGRPIRQSFTRTQADHFLQGTKSRNDSSKGESNAALKGLSFKGEAVQKFLFPDRFVSDNLQNTLMRSDKTAKTTKTIENQINAFAAQYGPVSQETWLLDSGANTYVCNDARWFTEYKPLRTKINTADNTSALQILGTGTIELRLADPDSGEFKLTLTDVVFAPGSRCNLISLSRLEKAGITAICTQGKISLFYQGYEVGSALSHNGLYQMQLAEREDDKHNGEYLAANVDFDDPVWKEHRRLGHLHIERMIRLARQSTGMNVTEAQIKAKRGAICPVCAETRAIVKIPRDPAGREATRILYRLHIDMWGPYPIPGWDRTRYFTFITDDFTRRTWDIRHETVEQLPELLRQKIKELQRRYEVDVAVIRQDRNLDRGAWKEWCQKHGINTEPSNAWEPNQVGRAERVHRTIREQAGTMIQETTIAGQISKIIEERGDELLRNTSIPEKLWPEAVHHATWLKARTPTRTLKWKQTPWEASEGAMPDCSRELIWGSRVYVSMTQEQRRYLGLNLKLHHKRGYIAYFMGHDSESQYRVWDPERENIRITDRIRPDDGQGTDDSHDGEPIHHRRVREEREPDGDTSPDEEPDNDGLDPESAENDDIPYAQPGDQGYVDPWGPDPSAENDLFMAADSSTGHGHSVQRTNSVSTGPPGANDTVPNFLARSGQSMKFSFAPPNELAWRTFGEEAFPTQIMHEGHQWNKTAGQTQQEHAAVAKKKMHPCPVAREFTCDKMFSKASNAKKHADTHIKTTWPCPKAEKFECERTFGRKDTAKRHADTVHKEHDNMNSESDSDVPLPLKRKRDSGKMTPARLRKCVRCSQRNLACDALLPIDPDNPCTKCTDAGAFCRPQEDKAREQSFDKCLDCKRKERRCDRLQPCRTCRNNEKQCSYRNESKDKVTTVLVSPKQPEEEGAHRGNTDRFIDGVRGCTFCQQKGRGKYCEAAENGPPCLYCMKRNLHHPSCTVWTAPGKCTSTSRAYYKVQTDEDGVEQVVWNEEGPEKGHKTNNKKTPKYSTNTDTDSETDDDNTTPVDIYGEESRAITREKLRNVKLPDSFLVDNNTIAMTSIQHSAETEPATYNEAINGPEAIYWTEAIRSEYDSLQENGTWSVAVLPPGRKALTTRWVFKKKLGPTGELLKYKARMVARGFQQVEGLDFTETYSGVVKPASYRILFALAAIYNWTCHQMDVATAFLNGDIGEEIYILPPPGFPQPGKVLKLKKALYGLKQAPRQWYKKLSSWLLETGWRTSSYDECVFIHAEERMVMTVYVDDLNIFGPDDSSICKFKQQLANKFKVTDAGRAGFYLGMQVEWHREGIRIHQKGYADQILNKFGFTQTKPTATPLVTGQKLTASEEQSTKAFQHEFLQKIGSLNYLQSKTRPDLAFPVSFVSRYMQNPGRSHMDALERQYTYLAGTTKAGLFYQQGSDDTITGFVDSDWGGCSDTGRSTTGWIFMLAGGPISWSSHRQRTVSQSSTEAEYVAASDACKEAAWLLGYRNEIATAMRTKGQPSITMNIDNASAIKVTKNPEFHGRTKHIDIRHHYIRECVENGTIIPEWISGRENPADLFTKALPRVTLEKFTARIGLQAAKYDDLIVNLAFTSMHNSGYNLDDFFRTDVDLKFDPEIIDNVYIQNFIEQESTTGQARDGASKMKEITSMTVAELKEELGKQGLAKTGKKADLVKRLQYNNTTSKYFDAPPEPTIKSEPLEEQQQHEQRLLQEEPEEEQDEEKEQKEEQDEEEQGEEEREKPLGEEQVQISGTQEQEKQEDNTDTSAPATSTPEDEFDMPDEDMIFTPENIKMLETPRKMQQVEDEYPMSDEEDVSEALANKGL